jgi:hypothetical protein
VEFSSYRFQHGRMWGVDSSGRLVPVEIDGVEVIRRSRNQDVAEYDRSFLKACGIEYGI